MNTRHKRGDVTKAVAALVAAHPDMNIIRPDRLPTLWWLNPWATARYLHDAATAMKAYADQADRCIEMQIRIIANKDREIDQLNETSTQQTNA